MLLKIKVKLESFITPVSIPFQDPVGVHNIGYQKSKKTSLSLKIIFIIVWKKLFQYYAQLHGIWQQSSY